jgi:hypothetical protein
LSGHRRPQNGNAFRLAALTTLRFVLELLVVKEQLFARGKDEVRAAVDTFENFVLKFHPSPHSPVALPCVEKQTAFRTREMRAELLRTPPRTITLDSAHLRIARRSTAEEETELPDRQPRRFLDGGEKKRAAASKQRPAGYQSCSFRVFSRRHSVASACFTRFVSPGFK